ncbi:hypothetical protein [uncultured Actinomyces sp.]|uniref:hypothetical protein n=1 Tax=uncultured Actinomyces sp. TaxID=249061 RepID=UPI0028D33848|nr:hypothetical protein [uncultured Actinomyces sp.]
MSSRASARFPTALAGTRPCAEAWEGLRSWDPPASRQSRAASGNRCGSRARPLGTDAAVAHYLHDEVEPRAARGNGERAKDARAGGWPPMEPVRQTVLWGQPVQLFTPPTPGE